MANKIGASGTPAFRINGVAVVGAQPFEKFKEVIDAQLAEAQKLVAAGTPKDKVYVELTKKNAASRPRSRRRSQARRAGRSPAAAARGHHRLQGGRRVGRPGARAKDALVTIVQWSDYQCPFCKRVEDTMKQVVDTYKGDVRVVWKDNALPFHPRAIPAAYVGIANYKAKGDKGFWDAHHTLFESAPKLEDEDLQGRRREARPRLGHHQEGHRRPRSTRRRSTPTWSRPTTSTPAVRRTSSSTAASSSGAQPFEKLQEGHRRRAREGRGPRGQGHSQGQGSTKRS